MRKRRKIGRTVSAVIIICIFVLGSVWVGDAARRFFHEPSDVVCIDERGVETETESESESEQDSDLADLGQEQDELEIQEANLGLAGLPAGYVTERRSVASLSEGILVCSADMQENLVDFESKNEYYHLKNMKLKIQESALSAMNSLAEARFQETGRSDLMVYSTSELYDKTGSLCPDFFPDRSTGFCLDLAFLNDDGTISALSEENNIWLRENCWHFGFIFSVPDSPYHIRYVGNIHAAIMQKQNLTLSEYLRILRGYSVSMPYECVYEEKQILIYFVPAAAFGYTDVPVPDHGIYEISGNGADGYIVTAYLN